MRRVLDTLYNTAAALAAVFMIGCLLMVLASVVGRLLGFHLRGADAWAGYCMAATGFLALAHTLKRGEHIRVTLVLERLSPRGRQRLEVFAHLLGVLFSGAFALFSVRLVWQSWQFGDISQGNDATPLWIPQLAMAFGGIVLLLAMLDECVLHLLRRHHASGHEHELKLME